MLMKKYKANPTDPSILIEYSDAAQNAVDMQSNASNCTDPKYASKLMELANKIAKSAM
jgi:flagellum-specific peptidoglycan hydrolase FlgJ